MSLQKNISLILYSTNRTVFRFNEIALLSGEQNFNSLNSKINYAVRTGKLLNPRKGIYTKPNFNEEEMACSVYSPSYISLEYVLQKTGVVFQYNPTLQSVSYLSRTININGTGYCYRKIKSGVLTNTAGIVRQANHVNIATAERAFLDLLYLEKNYFFDNLNPLNLKIIKQLLPIYQSEALKQRVKKISIMIDINKHRFFMVQILKDIYADIELANVLGFKGGTALMFFYDLPRFSVDLGFNLINQEKEEVVYKKVRKILLKHGTIYDEAKKFYGPIVVLDYGIGERKLKIEISNRIFPNHYEIKNLLGINVNVMTLPDMFAHKLCALLDRNTMTNRDIFDSWFFMKNQFPVNAKIIETRMNMTYSKYLQACIDNLELMNDKGLLQGLGELMDDEMKKFVRTKLRKDTISLMHFYKDYPIIL